MGEFDLFRYDLELSGPEPFIETSLRPGEERRSTEHDALHRSTTPLHRVQQGTDDKSLFKLFELEFHAGVWNLPAAEGQHSRVLNRHIWFVKYTPSPTQKPLLDPE